jgi:PAS domain S-box-containing protein
MKVTAPMPAPVHPAPGLTIEPEQLDRLFRQTPGVKAMLEGPDHRFVFANPAYLQLVGDRPVIGRTVAHALPDAAAQGYVGLLDQVFVSGEPYTAKGARYLVQQTPDQPGDERYLNFVYQPIKDEAGCVTGIFVDGIDVTDRIQADAALRESEARFRLMVDAVPEIIWITDPDGRMEFLNQQFGDYTGISIDGLTPEQVAARLIHADDAPAVTQAFAQALVTEQPFEIEHRIRSAAGEDRWFLARAKPHRDPATGRIARWFGVAVDIHDRKRAEARLTFREEQLRLATDIGEIGEWHVDHVMGEVFWPPRVRAMFGITTDRPVTQADFERGLHPDDGERIGRAYAAACDPAIRAFYDVEYRTIGLEDGLTRWVAAKARGLFDDDGVCLRVLGTAVDITARKANEHHLRQLNETLEARVAEQLAERDLLATLVESTDILIMAVDLDYKLLALNKANADEFERVYGVRPKAGDNLLALLDEWPEHREQVRLSWGRGLDGEEFTFIEPFGDPGRVRPYYEITFRTLRNRAGERIGAYQFVTDVTDRLRKQAQLAEAQEALRQTQKMEAMGSLTGGVAHDFNNLLTPIIGSLDLLQRRGIGGEREQRLIAGAIQSADRAKILVQRLLAFARRQPLQPTAVDIGALVHGMADLLGSTTGPQIRVVVHIEDDLPPAKADMNQLEMALLNLGVNARDAMTDGGTLRISATRGIIDQPRDGLCPGDYIQLSVADTGTGMDEATLARAVEPFFSTKGIGKGTGLGLSMAHGLAAQLGGAMTIQSRQGVGTNIELWLPVSSIRTATPQSVEAPSRSGRADGTVLLVDDEEVVRMSTADMLENIGFDVRQASSAEAALTMVEAGLVPDLLVTDHLMPGMTGVDLARALREQFAALPVLIVSGYAEAEGIAPDLPRLTKPFRSAELEACIAPFNLIAPTGLTDQAPCVPIPVGPSST